MTGPHTRVLVLGGGDGLAAREVLRYRDVASVTVVELDPGVVRLARTDPMLSALNAGAYEDPRLGVVTQDAFRWLRGPAARDRFDVIVSDLPNPGITPSTKLYSQEFYGLAARALRPGGRIAVHAGPLATRPRTYWTVESTLRAAGLQTSPYSAGGRLSGFAAGPDRSPCAAATRPRRTGASYWPPASRRPRCGWTVTRRGCARCRPARSRTPRATPSAPGCRDFRRRPCRTRGIRDPVRLSSVGSTAWSIRCSFRYRQTASAPCCATPSGWPGACRGSSRTPTPSPDPSPAG